MRSSLFFYNDRAFFTKNINSNQKKESYNNTKLNPASRRNKPLVYFDVEITYDRKFYRRALRSEFGAVQFDPLKTKSNRSDLLVFNQMVRIVIAGIQS
jgi:hypothetical protein